MPSLLGTGPGVHYKSVKTVNQATQREIVRLPSANLNRLTVPRFRLSTYGCRAFITLTRQSGTRYQMNLEILTVLMA